MAHLLTSGGRLLLSDGALLTDATGSDDPVISGVALDRNAVLRGAPTIGNIVVSASGSLTGQGYSLSDPSGHFSISGGALLAAPGTPAGSYIVAITATAGNAAPFMQDGITVAIDSIPLVLTNEDSVNSAAAPVAALMHAFAPGDIPAGSSVAAWDSAGNPAPAQQMLEATHPDGSLATASLLIRMSESLTKYGSAGDRAAYTLGVSAAAPDRTLAAGWSGNPLNDIAANSDLAFSFSGGDLGAASYTVSLNEIIAGINAGTFSMYPWGTNYPVAGARVRGTGKLAYVVEFFRFIKNTGTGAPHAYAQVRGYLRAFSPSGPFDVMAWFGQPSVQHPLPGGDGASAQWGRIACTAVVTNQGSVIATSGNGTSDWRIQSPTAINTSTNKLTWADQSLQGTGVVFSTTGTLPGGGLTAGTIYWPAFSAGATGGYLMTDRGHLIQVDSTNTPPAWVPGHAYVAGQYVLSNAIIYYCTGAGTSGSTGPSGTGAITDGTATWINVSIPFTDAGSGTLTATPVATCFPNGVSVFADRNGDPLWLGAGSRPRVMPGHDLAYLRTTLFIPPYRMDVDHQASNQPPPVFCPGSTGPYPWSLGTTGDGATDQRIGFVPNDGVSSLYNATDPYYYRTVITEALLFHNYNNSLFLDERDGLPFVGNNGPAKNGVAYANRAALNPTLDPGRPVAMGGTGKWMLVSPALKDKAGWAVQYYVDTAHQPCPAQVAYLKTGHPLFLDQLIHQGNWSAVGQYDKIKTVNGVSYYCLIGSEWQVGQIRGTGWGLRSLIQARHVCPDADPMKPVLTDMEDDNAAFLAVKYTKPYPVVPGVGSNQITDRAAAFGIMDGADHGLPGPVGHQSPWMVAFLYYAICMLVKRGRNPNWQVFKSYLNPHFNKLYVGRERWVGMYDLVYSPLSHDLTQVYTATDDFLTASQGYQTGPLTNPTLDDHPGWFHFSGGADDTSVTPAGFPSCCNLSPRIFIAAVNMGVWAEPGDTAMQSMAAALQARLDAAGNGLPDQWSGVSAGVVINGQTLAIASS